MYVCMNVHTILKLEIKIFTRIVEINEKELKIISHLRDLQKRAFYNNKFLI